MASVALAQDGRWKYVTSDLRWDTKTITKMQSSVTVWYEDKFIEEQRRQVQKTFGYLENEIVTGRYHVAIKCEERKAALLEIVWLNKQRNPITAPVQLKSDELSWQVAGPETNAEGILEDVCRSIPK